MKPEESGAKTIESESDALWEKYMALADEIDRLRWWNRPRRESDLRRRLQKIGLERDAVDHRLSSALGIAEGEPMIGSTESS